MESKCFFSLCGCLSPVSAALPKWVEKAFIFFPLYDLRFPLHSRLHVKKKKTRVILEI